MEELVNKGIARFGQTSSSEISNIVVIGTARGGTSMVAGALSELGVFMGDHAIPPVYEDLRLSTLFENKKYDEAKKVADEYTNNNKVWGWKRPSSINYLPRVDQVLGSPVYIFVYKDILSVANRNSISMNLEMLRGMQIALNDYQDSLEFLNQNKSTNLLVSYDKVVQNPLYFIDELIQFCKLTPSKEQYERALDFISLNPLSYLDKSRITKAQGRLGGLVQGQLTGWARYFHRPKERKTMVNIYLNDRFLVSSPANKFRKDLENRFNHSCAFYQDIPNDVTLVPGDVIRARVDQEVEDLDNSPLRLEASHFSENEGRLGGVRDGKIFGWAKTKHTPKKVEPLVVEIMLNDRVILTTEANQERADLRTRFGLDCGFNELLPKDIKLKKGDFLRARVIDDICDLDNSPLSANI